MPLPAARVRARVLMETLEPRILYSADLAAVAAMAGGDAGWTQEQRLQTTAQTTDQTAVRTEIAFVDLGIPEARSLVDGLLAERAASRPIEVVTIAADEDGLAIISRTLDERAAAGETFDAVHVFSHGQSGVVALGKSTLDADSLLRRAGEIAGWGSALSAQADLMLYGCDVAAGANGLFLIEGLAALTGADVAASDDLTGSAARGGDWLLEQHTGQIEAAVAADAALQQTWDGVLGSETQVNLTTAGDQNTDAETRGSQQAVTLDAAGNYTVVWTSGGQDGGGKGVYVRRFAYDGTALTGEIQVNTTTAKDQQNARIVGDSDGNFAVVWSSSNQDGTASSVYFRRFAADGTALTGEIRANATSTGSQSNAVIGMNASNGDLVVAWEGAGPTAGAVYFRRFAADGTALDAADLAVSTLGGEANAAVAMDATGRFVIAWDRANHMYFQRFDATGAAAGGITQVDNALSNSTGASIAMDSAGNFALAYTETKTLKGIWGRAFYADGSSRGTWFYADTATDATSPSISLAPDGTAVVVYQKGGDGGGKGVYARVVNADGILPSGGAVFLVNQTTSGDQLSASVAVHDASHFVVAWSGEDAADKQSVNVRTFEPANTAPQITSDGGGATAALSVAENTTAVTTVHATDADWPAPALVYTITGGADQAKFAIDSQSGALRFITPPNFELPADTGGDNVYNVVVSASDGQLSSTQALAVTVTNVDVNDQVSAQPDAVRIAYQTATSVDVLANDLLGAGPALTLLDLVQPTHGTAAISAGQVVYTPDAGYVGSDTLQYRVIDGSEGLAGYWSLDDNIGASAGEPSPVVGVHGQALQFNGVDDHVALAGVSYTKEFTLSCWFKLADNTGTSYRYLYSDGAAGTQNSLNIYFIEDATVTGSGIKNVLRTSLVDSNDGTAIANTSALDITATGLADNRWHQYTLTTVTGAGSSVYIDGTLRASSSQGGDTLTTSGSVLLGADSTLSAIRFLTGALDDVVLYDHTTVAASVAALASGPGDIGTVSIDVVPVNTQAPVITSDGGADAATVSLAENGTAVTVVTAYDADVGAPALTYTIVGGADQALFSMDAASGAVVFLAAPNFELPADTGADNVYYLTVQASDGVHVDTQDLRVVVTDANEYTVSPITDADGSANAVDENAAIGTTVGFTASAVDADGTTNAVTYSLDDSAGGLFAIDASTGTVMVAGLLDAETATNHTLIVRAASSDGSNQMLQVTVAVRDLNEASVATPFDADGTPNTVSESAAFGSTVGITASAVDADATNNTVTYTLTDNAGGRFAIGTSSGVVTVASALDAETALSHTVVVQATSADGSVASQSFTIAVQDVNEFGVSPITDLDSAAESVREDAAIGTAVGFQARAVDPDATNNAVTYALTNNAGGRFAIDASTGVVSVASALDAETALSHTIVVLATSSDGSVTTRNVTIAVQDLNESGIGAITDLDSAAESVREDAAIGTAVGFQARAVDPDATNSAVTYTLLDNAGGRFSIGAGTGVLTVASALDAEVALSHTVVVQATSADGSLTTRSVTIAVQDVNESGIGAISDLDSAAESVREDAAIGTAVGFQAHAVDADASNNAVTYSLALNLGNRFAIDATSGVVTVAAALDAETTPGYLLLVRAVSSDGSSSTRWLSVGVLDVNEFSVTVPVDADSATNAVNDNAVVGTRVGITASARDADATQNQIAYALADDASGRFAVDATTGVVTLARSVAADSGSTLNLVLQATSADGSVATQALTVAVSQTNLYAPVIQSDGGGASAALTVQENSSGPVTTVVATDADVSGVPLSYQIVGGADAARFTLDASTGVLRFVATPDAELPLDAGADNRYDLIIEASDGVLVDTQTLSVVVQDVNEAAISAVADVNLAADTVQENAAIGTVVGVQALAIDSDVTNNTVTYTLDDTAGGRFTIDAGTGVVTVAGLLDAETALSHTIVVRAVSSDGSATTLALTIAVQDVNEYGVGAVSDADAQANSVREDDPVGTIVGLTAQAQDLDATGNAVTYSLSDDAGGRFAIDATTGVVTIAQALDAETAQGHSIVVRALSADGSAQTQAFSIAVRDVDEFDLVAISDVDGADNAVAENAAVGTQVGITAQSVDADVTNNTVTYSLDDTAGGRFAIDARSGVVTVTGLLDAEVALSHTIVVRAASSDGSATTLALTIAVQDVNEYGVGAITDADAQANSVREDDPVGTVVGLTALAEDLDATSNTVSYSLTDDAGGRFSIDANTGVVTIARALDAETAQGHSIVVRALSADGSAQTQAFSITVRDVDEFDLVAVSDLDATADTVAEIAAVGTRVGITAQSVDADVSNNTVTYALLDNAGGCFAIDATTGVVTVAAPLDAETATAHTIVVLATSSDRSQWTQAYTVAVTDVDEFDLVTVSDAEAVADAVAENAAVGTRVGITALSVDADVSQNTVSYALLDDAGGRFAIDASSGVVTVAGALDAEVATRHTLVVQATSADGSVWAQAFTVQVTDVDEFDLVAVDDADATRNAVAENAAVGTAVGLRASSVDADLTTNAITYALDDSAGGRFAVDAATGVVTLARAVPDEGVATRTVVLRATSADGSTAAASFDIAILPVNEQAPVIDSDGGGAVAALAVDEGQTAVTQVLAHDNDLPADTLRYSLAGGADAALFTLDASTGVLRLAAAPDAETPLDQGADNVYDVTVQVSDGLHTDEQALRITVQPLNDTAPVITSDGGGATAVRHVAENTLAVTQVQAHDADLPADTLTYAVSGGADAALFKVDAATGALRWRAAPDRETPRDAGADGVYDVTVRVSDGLHTASQSLAVVVDNVDEAPRLNTNVLAILEGGTARPVLLASDVDTPAAALVYTVQDLTGGRFEQTTAPGVAVTRFTQAEVDAGAIRFVADGNEAAPAYRLTLADATTTLAPQAAQVAFTPVNDAPAAPAVDLGTVDEDTARVITSADLLAGASDAEGDALSVSTLRLTGGDGVLVDLGGGRWRFEPTADWHGAVTLACEVSDGQARVALEASLQVRAVNDAPRIASGGGAATLALDLAENTTEVTTVTGTDVDAEAPLRYAVVGGVDAAQFQIDAATGVLSFRQAPDREQPADANGDNRYDVLVEVSDGALTAQQALQITVTNVDEAPVVTRNVALITDGKVTLVLQASDQDTPATALTYRVDSVQGGQFELATAPGQAVTVFTQADLDAARVTWVAPAGSTTTAFALRLSDGRSEVRIGSPTPQHQAAVVVEMTLAAVAAGDSSAVPSASDSAKATAAPAAPIARRTDPVPPPLPDSAGDGVLGPSPRMAEDSSPVRGGGVRPEVVDAPVIRSSAARVAAVAEPPVEVALDLPSEGADAPKRLVTDMDLWGSRSGTSLAEQMDRLRQEVADAQQAGVVSLASTALVSTGLSVGYVIWLVRGGVLMTSLMSVVPAWAGMDPLPVLAEMRRAEGGAADADDADDSEGDDRDVDDPIEKLFSKARRLLVRPVASSPAAPEPPEISA
jgi:hypothetical protein